MKLPLLATRTFALLLLSVPSLARPPLTAIARRDLPDTRARESRPRCAAPRGSRHHREPRHAAAASGCRRPRRRRTRSRKHARRARARPERLGHRRRSRRAASRRRAPARCSCSWTTSRSTISRRDAWIGTRSSGAGAPDRSTCAVRLRSSTARPRWPGSNIVTHARGAAWPNGRRSPAAASAATTPRSARRGSGDRAGLDERVGAQAGRAGATTPRRVSTATPRAACGRSTARGPRVARARARGRPAPAGRATQSEGRRRDADDDARRRPRGPRSTARRSSRPAVAVARTHRARGRPGAPRGRARDRAVRAARPREPHASTRGEARLHWMPSEAHGLDVLVGGE